MTDRTIGAPGVGGDSPRDTPRMTYRLLSRQMTVAVVAVLLGLAAVAWASTVGRALSMGGMVSGLAQVGGGMPASTGGPVFLGMWLVMMVAMMFPAVAPIVLAHRSVVMRRGDGSLPTVAFVGGYLVVWTVAGLLPLAALLGIWEISAEAAGERWLGTLAGGVLVVAGAYQFTAWKTTCLRACRTPMSFVLTHDWGGGSRSALRAGLSHGLFCLGCCWALTSVMLVVGLMNLMWMAALTLVFVAEKNWRRALGLTRVVGTVLVALGAAVVVQPSILGGIG
ncbi:MAG: DUF2182 domain-containing protein [Actinomycetota bacterium]|nr:DUF2182 domain-containing protein [Actinomycetota bacterium]